MRMRIALIGLLLAAAVPAAGADPIELDLADVGGKYIVPPGTELTLRVLHRLPRGSYRYEAERIGLLAPLGLGAFDEEIKALDAQQTPSPDCVRLLDAIQRAGEGDSERLLRAALLDAKSRSPDDDCTNRIELYEDGTEVTLADTVTVGEGQLVVVTITRLEPGPTERWSFEIGTGEDRRWLIHYGFAFLPDENEEFFTRPVPGNDDGGGEGDDGGGEGDDGGGFTIVKSNDRGGADFEPTITFTYLPRTLGRNPWVPKFTAGLGADLEEQLVFAGLSWVIGDNVNLFVGAAGHEQTRLKGIYEEKDQVVQETLTGDQLVDETFELNVIFGVGFRFDRNPFKKADPPAPATGSGGQDNQTDQPKEPGSQGEDDGERDDGHQDDPDEGDEDDDDPDDGGGTGR